LDFKQGFQMNDVLQLPRIILRSETARAEIDDYSLRH